MPSHNYNNRLNFLTSNEESTLTEVSASNDAIVNAPSQINANTSQFSKTVTLIINLDEKMTSRFKGLDNELLNLKDVIIKNLKVVNERLRKKGNVLEKTFQLLKVSTTH